MTTPSVAQQIAQLQAELRDLAAKTPRLPIASVKTLVARGRRELGYESAYLSQTSANATASPTLGVTVNNDADFVALRPYLFQTGVAGAGIPIPPSVTLQIRDSATGNVFFRQPGSIGGSLVQGYNPGSAQSSGRFVSAKKPWHAPYILKKGSSVFFEISNPSGYTFVGDLYVVLEGYRIYPGEAEPIPETLSGAVDPFVWNGTLAVPTGLSAGVQPLGTISMPGVDQSRYVLTEAAVTATGSVSAVGGVQLFPEDVLLVNLQDTYQQLKLWARNSNPAPYGVAMPMKCLTLGGTGDEWAWPRFIQGTDTILVNLYGDPSAWASSAPGTIEVQLKGVRIYG